MILVISLLLLEGCAAPGSAVGKLKIQGALIDTDNRPIANKEIEFILPAAYGLGGLDLVMESPNDFGHKEQRLKVTTDENGNFETDLGKHVYHITFWLLPPLGVFPSRPPAPFVFARFPDNSTEYYAIQTSNGKFKIFDYAEKELTANNSLIENIDATEKKGSSSETAETIGVINFKIKSK